MRKLFIPLFALLLFSAECESEIEFVGNQRLLFKGRTIDFQGNPLASVPVKIYASRNFFDSGDFNPSSNDELLGEADTDADGSFSLITLSPSNALNIYAQINTFNRGIQANSTPIIVNGINFLEKDDFTFDLNVFTVEALRRFELGIERQNNTTDTLNYSFRYKPEVKNIDFNPYDGLGPIVYSDSGFSGVLTPDDSQAEFLLNVRENDTIYMEYRLLNSGSSQLEALQIVVKENENGFVFEF